MLKKTGTIPHNENKIVFLFLVLFHLCEKYLVSLSKYIKVFIAKLSNWILIYGKILPENFVSEISLFFMNENKTYK